MLYLLLFLNIPLRPDLYLKGFFIQKQPYNIFYLVTFPYLMIFNDFPPIFFCKLFLYVYIFIYSQLLFDCKSRIQGYPLCALITQILKFLSDSLSRIFPSLPALMLRNFIEDLFGRIFSVTTSVFVPAR